MRCKLTIAILLLVLFSGCTVEANRIYTVCKVDSDYTYCYNINDEFFRVEPDGKLTHISSVGLKDVPALVLNPSVGDYNFDYVLPGLYKGTLESVNHYVNTLEGVYRVSYRDWNNLEVYITTANADVRVYFNIRGNVRIYAVDKNGIAIEPPMLN